MAKALIYREGKYHKTLVHPKLWRLIQSVQEDAEENGNPGTVEYLDDNNNMFSNAELNTALAIADR